MIRSGDAEGRQLGRVMAVELAPIVSLGSPAERPRMIHRLLVRRELRLH